jgi:hypothetical protein
MLKVRKPGQGRIWQPPAKKTGRLENHVYVSFPEFSNCGIVQPDRQGRSEAGPTPVKSCQLYCLNTWDARKSLEIGSIVPLARENNWRDLAGAV